MSRTYRELIDQAVVNIQPCIGDIQNRGTASMTITVGGTTGRFTRHHNTQFFQQNTAGDRLESGVIAPIVSMASPFAVELVLWRRADAAVTNWSEMYQVNNGGFQITLDTGAYSVSSGLVVFLYNNAGAIARYRNTAANSFIVSTSEPYHVVLNIDPTTYIMTAIINNAPSSTMTGGGAGTPATSGNSAFYCCGAGSGKEEWALVRVWQTIIDTTEATTLYDNYQNLVVPSKC